MAVRRARFRVEQIQVESAAIASPEAGVLPRHDDVMAELRAIRQEMASSTHSESLAGARTTDEARLLLESYRAQIEQCEKLKVELDLIHEAIGRTKQEIAALHGKSFSGNEMTKVTGELGAVVGGTEEATQQILEAAESIDQLAAAIAAGTTPDQHKQMSEEIQERVVAIFEACNFQDLTGQRIGKVMTTMRYIEHHINEMMSIWGGVDAIKAHAPVVLDERVGDEKLLNGPRGAGDEGHVSQDDIDALFG